MIPSHNKKLLPVGMHDFEKLIADNYYFVDKSLLIKEVLDSGAQVTLIPRPRRFGKTINMSMLHYFFEKTEQSKLHLFTGLAIAQNQQAMAHQGKYPVIFMSFKDAKQDTWEQCYEHIVSLISRECKRHAYLLDDDLLSQKEKHDFQAVIDKNAHIVLYHNALKDLSDYLTRYYHVKPIILIDEYDAPVYSGVSHHYYQESISFLRSLLGGGLKDNNNLSFSIMTGILRVAKESIFSGLNNLKVCSLLNNRYADKFGFTKNETYDLLDYYEISKDHTLINMWYDGYVIGDQRQIFNPWSIINCVDNGGKIEPYWINTSDNKIIQDLIHKSPLYVKEDIENLLLGKIVEHPMYENIVLENILADQPKYDLVWSFLFFSGYLTVQKAELKGRDLVGELRIPNQEVHWMYEHIIKNWFASGISQSRYRTMLAALISGDIELFSEKFTELVVESLSYFDVTGKEPEAFYQAFILGLLVNLDDQYTISSNRESGYGRYDVVLFPKNVSNYGIIIELKKVRKSHSETLQTAADNALMQIEEKKYETELRSRGVQKIIKLGISFDGKEVCIKDVRTA
jgi:hypothetical protein